MALGATLLEIPLRHSRRVPNAEKAQPARLLLLPVWPWLWRVKRPCKTLNTSVFSATKDRLLEPCTTRGIPYFDIAVGAANCEP
jgi:hypothetical protein